MLSELLTWSLMLITFFIWGQFALTITYGKTVKFKPSYDLKIICGMALVNLYAQVFSLFGGVGMWAVIVMLLVTLAAGAYIFRTGDPGQKVLPDIKGVVRSRWSFMLLALAGVLLWDNMTPQHYDTYLYHAQFIHWIEDYGVVKGLANLHFRFAYNSAIMSPQALFSFKWLTGQSLHTLNGFFTLFYMAYIILTMGRRERPVMSDIMKLGTFLYILYDSFHVSSPNTDTVALLLACYILTKWTEYAEDKVTDVYAYGLLCILVVYATTIKLSVGILVLLVIYPAVLLVKNKRIAAIIGHLLAGIGLLAPYLIRNVLISGYILYPYEITKVNGLDWCLSEETLAQDRAQIIAWGRGNMDTSRNGEHIWQWIGDWYGSINILWKLLMPICLLAIVYLIVKLIKDRESRQNRAMLTLLLMLPVGLIFWLLTAPLPRYGTIYMIMLPSGAAYYLLKAFADKRENIRSRLKGGINILTALALMAYLIIYVGYSIYMGTGRPQLLMQYDYDNKAYEISYLENIEVAVPASGDQVGYEPFPQTPYGEMLESLRLRGEDISDGFKY